MNTFPAEPLRVTTSRSSDTEILRVQHSLSTVDILCRILDAMPELVMILNRNRQIVFGNQAVREFAGGREVGHYLGLRPGEFFDCCNLGGALKVCGTTEGCQSCGLLVSFLDSLGGQPARHECRVSRCTQAGPESLDLRISATPFVWQDDDYVLLVAVNISDQKRRQVLERIFFHDILNTAGGLHGLATLFADGTLEAEEVKSDLCTASELLVSEIRSQRLLLAAEANELAVDSKPLTSRQCLKSVAGAMGNHEIARGKSIRIAEDTSDCFFRSDPTLLMRVLGNLVKNALEASAAGAVVTIGCRSATNQLSFWCHNAGVMPAVVQRQMFQRSFSTKGQGRGIGTYSVRLLAEKFLKGDVGFVSSVEKGTVFTVTLPLHLKADGADQPAGSAEAP